MKPRPAIPPHDDYEAVVVRTDFSDEAAWQDVTRELTERWGYGAFESWIQLVDDPGWADASADEVLAAMPSEAEVVFLADRVTMRADHHALLAVNTLACGDFESDEHHEALTEFRTVPVGVSEIHTNVFIANMDFEEFAASARRDPEGVHRSF